jgi:hypothetical protein
MTLCPAVLDRNVLPIGVTGFSQPFEKGRQRPRVTCCEGRIQKADHRHRLLRTHSERPRRGGTADNCDEFPSPHGFARAEDYIG